jgi:hypothetical protein
MHAARPAPDPARLTPWLQVFAPEHDGLEVPGLSALFALYLAGAWMLARSVPRLRLYGADRAWLAAALPAAWIVLATRSWDFTPLGPKAWKIHLGFLGLAAAAWAAWRAYDRATLPFVKRAGPWAFGAALVLGVLFISPPPSVFDYGFFMGPAAKLLQGEAFGTFYRQYGLGETLLFAGMMKAGLPLTSMQAVLGLALGAWILMYHRLALRIFSYRPLAHLFLAGLLILRVGAFRFPTLDAPQVSPLRLDLWVPALLVWSRFGFASPATSLAFAGIYLCDDLFGALHAGLYAAALIGGYLLGRPALRSLGPRGVVLRLAPLAAVAAFYIHAQGSPLSPAGSLYKNLQLGFLPVDPHSLFWPMAAAMGLAAAVLAPERRAIKLFLLPVAWVQFTYFFGRSHENNLLSLSGSMALIVFLGLDALGARLRGRGADALGRRLPVRLACAGLLLSAILFEDGLYARVAQAGRNLAARAPVQRADIEIGADAYPDFPARFPGRRIFFVSKTDAYLYYKYRLPEPGFWAPFAAWYDLDSAAAYVRDRIRAGDAAVVEGWDSQGELLDLNRSRVLRDAGLSLAIALENGCEVLVLRPDGVAAHRP